MRALIDTHALLWFLADDPRLGPAARALMTAGGNDLLFSIAGCWELAIKCSLGKVRLAEPFERFLWPQLRANAIDVLPILPDHLDALGALPPHHRDPFDRLLVAQARVEGVPLVSGDAALAGYPVTLVW